MVEMLDNLKGLSFWTRFIARNQRRTVLHLERQVKLLANTVDRFYDLLGPRNWIFHDDLNPDRIDPLLDLPADQAERALIDYYKDQSALGFMIGRLRQFPEFRSRMTLIELAEADFHAGRFYATVQTLLSVMDGFVNDVEPDVRRGLHARQENEMTAWDSVVGHHLGLRHAHATFMKTFHKTSTEEVRELYRNGIVHGMLVSYDNDIVGAKAWNRLFAVADWASSRKKAREPAMERPSMWQSLLEYSEHQRKHRLVMESIERWKPASIRSGDESFETDPIAAISREFLDAWRSRNYGRMANCLSPLVAEETESKTAGQLREDYESRVLDSYELLELAHVAPAVATMRATLKLGDELQPVALRWVRSGADGRSVAPIEPGSWRLIHWSVESMRDHEAPA